MDTSRPGTLTRRALLRNCAAGLAGGVFAHCFPARAATRAPKAKSVIQIWMWGGPSHLDTFDPKPGAGRDYCGPLDQVIDTNADGVRINATLPLLARHADKYSIIRGMTHGINAHETAAYMVQTGREPGRVVFPSAGAVVSLFRGHGAGYTGAAPPYVVLTTAQGRFSEAGFLDRKHKPFVTGGDPNRDPFAVEGLVLEGVSDERQEQRRDYLHRLDALGRAMPDTPAFAKLDKAEEEAYDMMFGEARELFDLASEPDAVRESYGRNTFGQSCLMARRLAEAGVPYVTVNYNGWDTHKQHFQIMERKLPEMDQGMSVLLADLSDRGLLDSTIVWWSGEFGRTPRVQWEPPWNGGRGHYGACFSAVLAGGGFRGGQVVGASDARGEEVADRPVSPRDVIASMYELMGVDPGADMPNDAGLDVPVLPSEAEDTIGGGVLREIM
jgi:hypothetical protein